MNIILAINSMYSIRRSEQIWNGFCNREQKTEAAKLKIVFVEFDRKKKFIHRFSGFNSNEYIMGKENEEKKITGFRKDFGARDGMSFIVVCCILLLFIPTSPPRS